jgi:hypothetical protein
MAVSPRSDVPINGSALSARSLRTSTFGLFCRKTIYSHLRAALQILSGIAFRSTFGEHDILFNATTSLLINPHAFTGADFDRTASSQEFGVNAFWSFSTE